MRAFCFPTFCLLLAVSCIPIFFLPLNTEADIWQKELSIEYQLAFEKRSYVNLKALQQLESKTRKALADGEIAATHVTTVRQHHHKLKSYLVWLQVAAILEKTGLIKEDLTALILDKLRQSDVAQIDLTRTNEDVFQQVMAGEFSTQNISRTAKQSFYKELLAVMIEMTETTISLQRYLFPFLVGDFDALCKRHSKEDCQRFLLVASDKRGRQPFTDIAQVAKRINYTIARLNVVIDTLNRLQAVKKGLVFSETDFEDENVIFLYNYYELILTNALQQGVLPVLFADSFRRKSGNIWLKQNSISKIYNKSLTAVTPTTVAQALKETQRELFQSLAQLQKMQRAKTPPRDKKLYQWVTNNEVAVARVLAQSPAHAPLVAHLLHRYQDKARNPILKFFDAIITSVELSCLLMIVPALAVSTIPALAVYNLPRTIAFVGTMMNFPWIAMTQSKHIIARNRYLMLERALLRGSSQRVNYNLKLLHELHRLRKYAIISGALGFTMSVPAMRYIIDNADVGFRNNLVDIVSSVFADYENFTMLMYENRIDMSERELEKKPGH